MWATTVSADIDWGMLDGRSAFGNARVPRYTPDIDASQRLAADGDLAGEIAISVLTLRGNVDLTVFVENHAAYRVTLERAGALAWLVQVFDDEQGHAKVPPPLYPAALGALADWADTWRRPGTKEAPGR